MSDFEKHDGIPLADEDQEQDMSEIKTDLVVGNLKPARPLKDFGSPEDKLRVMEQILELQNTLEDLINRIDIVKEESSRLMTENHMLGKYIRTLMSSSSLFQPTRKS